MANEKRLIDAAVLLEELEELHSYSKRSFDYNVAVVDAISMVEIAPTVDAVEVVHGRWVDNGIPDSMLSGCSVCGFSCGTYSFNYCPKCGAKMDGERKDNA